MSLLNAAEAKAYVNDKALADEVKKDFAGLEKETDQIIRATARTGLNQTTISFIKGNVNLEHIDRLISLLQEKGYHVSRSEQDNYYYLHINWK